MEIALKSVAGQFNPVQINLTRFFIGGLFLIPFAWKTIQKRGEHLNVSALLNFAFLGFLGVVVSMNFYQLAVENANASEVAILFSSNPVFILLFSGLILHEVIKKNQIIAILLEVIGLVVIINPLHTKMSVFGVVMSLLAAIAFGIYSVLGKKNCTRYGGLVVSCGCFICAGIEMAILVAISHITPVAGFLTTHGFDLFSNIPVFTGYTASNIAVMLYICIAVTGGGFAFYFMAMEETSASTASLVFFFKPVLSPIFAMIILGELIPFNMVVGIIFILVGSVANLLPAFRNKPKIIAEH